MAENGLVSKLKKGLLIISLLVGFLGFLGTVEAASLSQTVILVNDVDIDYTAILTGVDSEKRIIERNGNVISRTTITTSPYHEILEDMRKGKYTFTLRKKGVTPNTVTLRVPNYAPMADFTSLETNIV